MLKTITVEKGCGWINANAHFWALKAAYNCFAQWCEVLKSELRVLHWMPCSYPENLSLVEVSGRLLHNLLPGNCNGVISAERSWQSECRSAKGLKRGKSLALSAPLLPLPDPVGTHSSHWWGWRALPGLAELEQGAQGTSLLVPVDVRDLGLSKLLLRIRQGGLRAGLPPCR